MPSAGRCEELAGQHSPATLVPAAYTLDTRSGTGPTSVLPSPSAMPLISAAQIPDLKLSLPTASFDAPPTGLGLYLRYALAGAVCCSFTHAVLTPIDV